MTDPKVGVNVSGGQIQGVVGADHVAITHLIINNYAPPIAEPAATSAVQIETESAIVAAC